MVKVCSVVWCANTSKQISAKLSLHVFPADPELCEQWVEFCRRDEINDRLVLQGVDAIRGSCHMICSDHFEEQCFYNPNWTGQGLLKGSVPTVLAGHPLLLAEYLKSHLAPTNSTKQRTGVPGTPEKQEPKRVGPPPSVEEILTRLRAPPPSRNDNKAAEFKCHCEEEQRERTSFFKERSRAEALVKEIDATKEKISKVKYSSRKEKRFVSRVNGGINDLKAKIRKLAEEHGAPADISSDDDSEESNFSD